MADPADPTTSAHVTAAAATAYVAMLPFAYTNNDVAQLFVPFGRLARVTLLRDRQSRASRGVAFVQFARSDDCARAVAAMHGAQLEGFTLACSLSRDNGRAREFAKRKRTPTAARCFECGEPDHFSYDCPRNVLGAREKPAPRRKKRRRYDPAERAHFFDDHGAVNLLAPATEADMDVSISLLARAPPQFATTAVHGPDASGGRPKGRRVRKPASYFSDEDASDGDD